MTGTKGDSDRLTIRVFANATGIAEGQSDVTLRVSATAQSMIGTDTAPVECGSTGRLERAIFSAVTRDCRFPTPRCANATAIDAVAFGTAKTKR